MAEDRGDGGETVSPPQGKGVAPPDEAVWTALWVSFRDGTRSKDRLKRMHRLSWKTINQAIEHGWPEKGWPSFKDRLELWDKQKDRSTAQVLAETDRLAAEAAAQQKAVTWKTFQPKAAKLCAESLGALVTLGGKLNEAIKVASFVRYRRVRERVRDAAGNVTGVVVVDQAYVDGTAVSQAMRVFSSAFKETGTLMSFLMGGPSGRIEVGSHLPELTADQKEQLRRGELPEGVSLEQVAAAFLHDDKYQQGGS